MSNPRNMKFYASDPIYAQSFESIDREGGVIQGCKVCSEGEAKGHGVWLNEKFIKDVAKFGRSQKQGVKARFGHPNMCSTALGTFIGRYRNFRIETEEGIDGFDDYDSEELAKEGKPPKQKGYRTHAVADLHLDETAQNLPNLGDAYNYVLDMAEKNPDMFGNSIVFKPGDAIKREWKTDDGVTHRRYEATIISLLATDVVDNPAATDSLFENFDNEDELAMQVTHFLDQHPEVYDLAAKHPEVVESFMSRYAEYRDAKETATTKNSIDMSDDKKTLKEMFADFRSELIEMLGLGKDDALPTEVAEKLTEFDTRIKEAEEAADDSEAAEEIETLGTQLEEAQADATAKDEKITSLEARVSELEGKLTKKNGASTKLDAPEGLENDDKPVKGEIASLNKDAEKIRNEMLTPHGDDD